MPTCFNWFWSTLAYWRVGALAALILRKMGCLKRVACVPRVPPPHAATSDAVRTSRAQTVVSWWRLILNPPSVHVVHLAVQFGHFGRKLLEALGVERERRFRQRLEG